MSHVWPLANMGCARQQKLMTRCFVRGKFLHLRKYYKIAHGFGGYVVRVFMRFSYMRVGRRSMMCCSYDCSRNLYVHRGITAHQLEYYCLTCYCTPSRVLLHDRRSDTTLLLEFYFMNNIMLLHPVRVFLHFCCTVKDWATVAYQQEVDPVRYMLYHALPSTSATPQRSCRLRIEDLDGVCV